MSAFLQSFNVRFWAGPPGRAFHCGRSFRRGRFMPEKSLAGAEAAASPHFFLQ